jgi:3-oxoacyl-[acyl-carrier protein] reductase
MLEISLKGRKAFITGGSRGIGAEICRVLAECGADVAFTYKENVKAAEDLVKELVPKHVHIFSTQAAAEDEHVMAVAVDNAAKAFGGLDILVANVAGGQKASLTELSIEDWRKGLEINLTSAYIACMLVYPYLRKARRSDIILIGSSAAYDGGGSVPYYATAKEGLVGLTRYLMRELSDKNVRINTIHPCMVDTDGFRKYRNTPEIVEKLRDQVPLGRLSKAEDIANLVAFMCSDLCEFMTGQSILVDGGRTLWKKEQKKVP